MGASFVLTLPHVAFVIYFSLQFPRGHWPTWFTDSILIWFVANCLIVALLAQRLAKRKSAELEPAHRSLTSSKIGVWIMRIGFPPLVILWSFEFLRGAQEAFKGKIPLNRAIPAGAFLLFFIAIFGWAVYRAWTVRA